MKIDLPGNARAIIARLREAGFEAYAVGGCVRDSLLGREPKDWDITTSALPSDIKRLFLRTVDTGIEHGTVTVLTGGEAYETTTYRLDGKYTDSRHPDSVEFSTSLEEDLKRRDFTINAMAYSDETGLVDIYGGERDLNDRIIRCVGNPMERFGEDALRILRAVRFAAQLDFGIEESTFHAAALLVQKLKLISAERIREELHKLLMSDHPEKLVILHEMGIDSVVLPELAVYAARLNDLIDLLKRADASSYIRWGLLMDFVSGDASSEEKAVAAGHILRRLKFDNDTVYAVKKLMTFKNAPVEGITDHEMRILMNRAGVEDLKLIFRFRTVLKGENGAESLRNAYLQYERIVQAGDCVDLKTLAVDGNDLIKAGVPKGREIGIILNSLLDKVLENPGLNEREQLMELFRKNLS
ncbi:MAG: CCA tRNA nucleotidyltransferase [Lachnospiraceae bacterium]|nr:CCA tRNA nucleotidyltransferase [Lachnospiraceae bacterium]